MGNKFTYIKERVTQIADYKGVNKEKFFKEIGMTSANFRGEAKKTPLNSNAVENILSIYPDINPTWLLTGEGEMTGRDMTIDYKIDIDIQILSNIRQLKFLKDKITDINTIIDSHLKIPRVDDGSDFITKLTISKNFDTDYLHKWENLNIDDKRDLNYQLEQSVKILTDTFFERFKFLYEKTQGFVNLENKQ